MPFVSSCIFQSHSKKVPFASYARDVAVNATFQSLKKLLFEVGRVFVAHISLLIRHCLFKPLSLAYRQLPSKQSTLEATGSSCSLSAAVLAVMPLADNNSTEWPFTSPVRIEWVTQGALESATYACHHIPSPTAVLPPEDESSDQGVTPNGDDSTLVETIAQQCPALSVPVLSRSSAIAIYPDVLFLFLFFSVYAICLFSWIVSGYYSWLPVWWYPFHCSWRPLLLMRWRRFLLALLITRSVSHMSLQIIGLLASSPAWQGGRLY